MNVPVWRSVTGLLAMMAGAAAEAAEPATSVQGPGATLQTVGTAPATLVSFPPRFPAAARSSGHEDGDALVAATIDADGRVLDTVTLSASHRAFGSAAEAALRQWTFVAAASDTRPRRELVEFEFRSKGTITVLTHVESARENVVPANREQVLRTVAWSTLESPPRRLEGAMPKLSESARARLADRPVTASFVIDDEGAVHVPVVPGETDAEVAQIVLDALRGWRFAPTVSEGRPVAVQAERAFQVAGGAR